MNWAITILTSPRPKGPTLQRMLDSLALAGWPNATVYNDVAGAGQFRAWMAALAGTVRQCPDADVYFMLEDDVVFCRGLRAYLERSLWPEAPEHVAICSPYCPTPYRSSARGWHAEHRGCYLVSALSWAIPPQAARAVLADLHPLLETTGPLRGSDFLVGQWAASTGRRVWFHGPSLGQHVGMGNSAVGDGLETPMRTAADFIGEEAYP